MTDTPAPDTGHALPSGTWTIPHVGKVKKSYVIIGGLVLAAGGIIWWRKTHQAAPAGSGLQTDPAGNIGVLNPATGFVLGSPEDLAASGGAGSGSGSGGGGGGSGSDQTSTDAQVQAGPPFTNNAAWAQYVTAYAVGTLNMDPGTVSSDIGAYLAGEQVSPAVKHVIDTLAGYGGKPPVAGPNGFPPSVNVVGDVTGTNSAPGGVNLKRGAVTATTAKFTWDKVTGADGYFYHATGPGYDKSGRLAAAAASLSGLKAGQTYTMAVHALSGTTPGPDASVTFTTPAPASSTPTPAAYATVVVETYTSSNAPWQSTISGIAAHYGYGGDWEAVWNDPKNANLRALRKEPNLIRKGDVVYVKEK